MNDKEKEIALAEYEDLAFTFGLKEKCKTSGDVYTVEMNPYDGESHIVVQKKHGGCML